MKLLAVDPGVRACGWALLEHGLEGKVRFFRLVECGIDQSEGIQYSTDMPHFVDMAIRIGQIPCERFVVEAPQIYRTDQQRGRQSDIARLLVLCGVLCGVRGYGELVLPHAWKGGIPKPDKASDIESYIVHRRNLETFGKGYLSNEVPLGKAHNVADAVGLGLWRVRQSLTDMRL
jgi:hypothetical protein